MTASPFQASKQPEPRRGRTYLKTVGELAYERKQWDRIEGAFKTQNGPRRWDLTRIMDVPVHVGNLGRTAGWARYSPIVIELHEGLWTPQFEGNLDETFIHEVAHIIDRFERGDSDHSALWKKVMIRLAAKPTRCHSMLELGKKDYSFVYCHTCGHAQRTSVPEKMAGNVCNMCSKYSKPRPRYAAQRMKGQTYWG